MAADPVSTMLITDLTVGGMTCGACVTRVEKKLGRLDGVTATVNLATGSARVSHPADISRDELVATVEKAGYTAALPRPPEKREPTGDDRGDGGDGGGESEAARQERH